MKDIRLSFLLHALLFAILFALPVSRGQGEAEGTGKKFDYAEVEILPPPAAEAVPAVEDEGLRELKKRVPHIGDKCEKFYGGIGVIDSSVGITSVYPGYPAALAGIQVGDEIIGDEEIRGEVGTPVTVEVMRGYRRITFHLIRDKICVL